jgi:prephenate dehydrogenase
MKVGIVGLGLIGGSMAKSIKARTSHTVYGSDPDRETMSLARMCGAIDAPLTEEHLPECDLILIAVRPGAAVEWVRSHAQDIAKSAIVVDLCGIKRAVVQGIAPIAEQYGFAYIGGHPMAGKERGGFVNATDDLYVGASMILTPDSRSDLPLLETLKAFFLDIGFAGLTFSDPEEHDRIIAYTSQLAHITSSAYVKSPEAQRRRGFSAGSFQDMTRVAKLDEGMWTELFLDNADFLTEQVDLLVRHLSEYLEALRARDADKLRALLKDGREKKASAGGN